MRKKKKSNPDTMGKYATLPQIASLLKVDPRTINRRSDPKDRLYIKGFGPEKKGQYDIVKCVHIILEDYERRLSEAQSGFKNAKEFNYKLDAQKKELELAELKKELIRVDETASLLDKIINITKTKLPTSRKTLMPKLLIAKDDKAVIKILETRDNELLNDLSTAIENIIRGLAESSGENYTASRPAKTKKRRKS
ncbi:MAG: hypothetical protein WC879_03490 [Melioribacteraceae bacterium]